MFSGLIHSAGLPRRSAASMACRGTALNGMLPVSLRNKGEGRSNSTLNVKSSGARNAELVRALRSPLNVPRIAQAVQHVRIRRGGGRVDDAAPRVHEVVGRNHGSIRPPRGRSSISAGQACPARVRVASEEELDPRIVGVCFVVGRQSRRGLHGLRVVRGKPFEYRRQNVYLEIAGVVAWIESGRLRAECELEDAPRRRGCVSEVVRSFAASGEHESVRRSHRGAKWGLA